jgi:hypothetical protein
MRSSTNWLAGSRTPGSSKISSFFSIILRQTFVSASPQAQSDSLWLYSV